MRVKPSVELTIIYRISPEVTNHDLNMLFDAAWPAHIQTDFKPILARSLAFICAYDTEQLVGFVNLAWDGGLHAFVLDTTVHPNFRRRGTGRELVRQAISVAQERNIAWLHVDFEPRLRGFYQGCGFQLTEAGLIHLEPRP